MQLIKSKLGVLIMRGARKLLMSVSLIPSRVDMAVRSVRLFIGGVKKQLPSGVVSVILVCLVSANVWGVFNDQTLYFKSGSSYKLTPAQSNDVYVVAQKIVTAAALSQNLVGGVNSSSGSGSFPLPFSNDFGEDYNLNDYNYSNSVGGNPSPYTFTLYQSTTGGIGVANSYRRCTGMNNHQYAGISCFNAHHKTFDIAGNVISETYGGELPIENVVGYCFDEVEAWNSSIEDHYLYTQDWSTCYVSAGQPWTVPITTHTGEFTSPAQYQELTEIRRLLTLALSSATASGLPGVQIAVITQALNWVNNGYVVPSSGTTSGSGESGTTAGSTITVNVQPWDYVLVGDTSGAWDSYVSSSPDGSIFTQLVDTRFAQASATVSGLSQLIDNLAQFDDSAYDPCVVSGTVHGLGGYTLGEFNLTSMPFYHTFVTWGVWFFRALAIVYAVTIIFA